MLKQYIDDFEIVIQRAEYYLAELQLQISEDGKFLGHQGASKELYTRATFVQMQLDYLYNQTLDNNEDRLKLETILLSLNSLVQKPIC
jgi:hypothetical protein